MKVKLIYLVIPVVAIVLLIVTVTYILRAFNLEGASLGFEYKEKLFQKDKLAEINIRVDEEEWNQLLANPTAEQYIEAIVTVNDDTFEHVGIRAKGNSSLSSVASSDSNRYSLKLDFSQYDSNQSYFGLEKVNLNNNFSDTTQMKEYVSYELMNQLSIPTPAYAYTKVILNGEYYGLMLAVEEIGEAFVRTNYETSEGYIFKPEGNGSDLKYVSDSISDYDGIFNEVKYNEKTAKNNSTIISMMKEISQGDTSSLNVDLIARYFALNTALVNMDSYQGMFKHNYYLYEDKDGLFSIVPWDYNMSFGGFTGMGGGIGQAPGRMRNQNMKEQLNEKLNEETNNNINENLPNDNRENNISNGNGPGRNGLNISQSMMTVSNINFSIAEPLSGTTLDERPLLKAILENDETRKLYEHYLEYISKHLFTESNIGSITAQLKTILLDAIEDDPSKFSTTEQFLIGVEGNESLAAFAVARSESILNQLDGGMEDVVANDFTSLEVPPNWTENAGGDNTEGVDGAMPQPPNWGENGEGVNGVMPQPPNWGDNAEGLEGAMPQPPNWGDNAEGFNGAMPQPPNWGENAEGFNGAMPQRPNWNINGEDAKGSSRSTISPAIQYVVSFVILAVAIIYIVFMNNRRFNKGR